MPKLKAESVAAFHAEMEHIAQIERAVDEVRAVVAAERADLARPRNRAERRRLKRAR